MGFRKNIILLCALFITAISASFATECWQHATTAECESDGCSWHIDDWGSWCEDKGCWNYYNENDCPENITGTSKHCQWQAGGQQWGWCEQPTCWSFTGTNETTCESNSNDLACLWLAECDGASYCWDITNQTTCTNTQGCRWGNCDSNSCSDYSTSAACTAGTGGTGNSCDWNSQYNYCYEVGCWDNDNEEDCTAESCKWSNGYCSEYYCGDFSFTSAGGCVNNTANRSCSWNEPWCSDVGCMTIQNSTACAANNCNWKTNQQSGNCMEVDCWAFDQTNQTACEANSFGIDCIWDNNGHWCYKDNSGVSCTNMTTERTCLDTFFCWWQFTDPNDPSLGGTCQEPGQAGSFFQEWNPGCYIFDSAAADCNNLTGVCSHNGTNCNPLIDLPNGINCSTINYSTLCNNIPALSTCCIWQGSACEENRFSNSCREDMEQAPEGATYCEDFNAYTSQTLCEQIAGSPWYMPCAWNAEEEYCGFRSDDVFGEGTQSIMLIDNQQNCEFAGGKWLIENYCEGNISVPAGRCEFKFEDERNCDKACFACEYQGDGSIWESATDAEDACRGSGLGYCQFEADTDARNEFGFCKPKEEYKRGVAKDCKADCGACSFMGDSDSPTKYSGAEPRYDTCLAPSCFCDKSPANCKWIGDPVYPTDESKGHCSGINEKTCADRCDKCNDEQSCNQAGQGGNGACSWDATVLICKLTNGANSMEICWDGVDNDDNGNTDCADSKCFSDMYCGGGTMTDTVNCAGYETNATCTSANCSWMNETWGAWCDSPSSVCWKNDGNQAACEAEALSEFCDWHSGFGGFCTMDESIAENCWTKPDNATCALAAGDGCVWNVDQWCVDVGGWCSGDYLCNGRDQAACTGDCTWNADPRCEGGAGWCDYAMFSCWQYQAQAACNLHADVCAWMFDEYSPNGGFCNPDSDCPSYNTNTTCLDNDCSWTSGFCDPLGFGGEGGGGGGGSMGMQCFLYDGDEPACTAQQGCSYSLNNQAFCGVNNSMNCPELSYDETGDACRLNTLCTWREGPQPFCDFKAMECMWNQTLQGDDETCENNPFCMWADDLLPGMRCEPECANGDLNVNTCRLVNVLNTTFCSWMSGWCNPTGTTQAFQGMQGGAPVMLGMDPAGDAQEWVDIIGFGMKDMGDSFGFGTSVADMTDSVICNGEQMGQQQGSSGSGTATSKFYWYLDTNGNENNGCPLKDDDSSEGWDFFFKYIATWSGSAVSEQLNSYKCVDGQWGAADIMISTWRQAMCKEISGGMIAVPKSDLAKFETLYDPTADMRVFVATANDSQNASIPVDTAGPGWTTPGSVDFELTDMFSMNGGGAQFEDVLFRGYTQYEDCLNSIDDDKDGDADCNDYDCQFETNCEGKGVNDPLFEDTSSPSITNLKTEEYPNAALLMYDTDKPTNGTLEFYNDDSTCGTLNDTIYDIGILSTNVRNYKVWHTAQIFNDVGSSSLTYDLTPDTAYYYKLKVCDYSGKCAVSQCSSFRTSSVASCGYCDFVVRIKTSSDWIVSYDVDQNGVYEHVQGQVCGANAGMKVNYTDARGVNIKLTNEDNSTYLEFINATLTKAALNDKVRTISDEGAINSGTTDGTGGGTVGYAGIIADTRDKIVNNLHPEICRIKIPSTGVCNHLWHCEDDLGTCVDMTDEEGTELIDATECIWQLPYCQFSVWANGEPGTTTAGDDTTTSSGGSGGGGFGNLANKATEKTQSWVSILAGKTATMTISSQAISITKVAFVAQKALTNSKLQVKALGTKPQATTEATTAYQYFELVPTNLANAGQATIDFNVNRTWLTTQQATPGDVKLFRYVQSAWVALPTTQVSNTSDFFRFQATTPGFSYFAIGVGKEQEVTPVVPPPPPTPPPTTPPPTPPLPPSEGEPEPIPDEVTSSPFPWIWALMIVAIAVIIGVIFLKPKKK